MSADAYPDLDGLAAASRWLAGTAPDERAALLERIADAILVAKDDLVPIAAEETGLPEDRLMGEHARTVAQFRLAADVVRDGAWLDVSITHADASASPPVPDHRRMNVPLGPVLVFAASNFPLAFGVAGTDTASALAAGCAVAAKAHPGHPRLGDALASVVRSALADEPLVWTHVPGEHAAAVLADPRIAAGAFTGSTAGGIALGRIAADRVPPIPFYAEMGSVNPVIVTEAAWRERGDEILDGLAASMLVGNGQLCTSPGLLFVPESAQLRVPAPLGDRGPAPLLTDQIAQSFRSGMSDLAASADVKPLTPVELADGRAARPALWETDVSAVTADPSLLEERFGPSSIVVRYRSADELAALFEGLDGQLTTSIFAEPRDDVGALVEAAVSRAGRVVFDGWPTGVAVSWSMHHGGPWPAASAPGYGSVGAEAVRRFLRPVVLQSAPAGSLPPALQDENPWRLPRRVDGRLEIAAHA